jgi:hypothetical protein
VNFCPIFDRFTKKTGMIARNFTLFSALAALLIFTQCEALRSRSSGGLHVTGMVGEIMVVCESDIWNDEMQMYLDSGLTQYIAPYPAVATFELLQRTPDRFEGSFKRYRNALFLKIDPKHKGKTGLIEVREDVWANGQMVIDVTARDYKQLLETIQSSVGEIHSRFDTAEWKRLMERYQEKPDNILAQALKENFSIGASFPNGSKIVTYRTNFFRIEFPKIFRPLDMGEEGTDAGGIHSGVLVYQYDYIDTSQLTLEKLLTARDTMLKYNVPSEIQGMYMGTQYVDYVYPEWNHASSATGKIKGFDMRGMYVFQGNGKAGTGGAFWAFHFVNPKTKKVVCISGYVDAPPTTSWTQPLREIQAVLRSVYIVQ